LLQAQEFFFPLGVKITFQSLSCLLDDVAPAAAIYRVFSPSFSLFAAMEVFTSAISRDVGGVGGGIVYSLRNSYQHFAYLL
jgi:hypothetical protein